MHPTPEEPAKTPNPASAPAASPAASPPQGSNWLAYLILAIVVVGVVLLIRHIANKPKPVSVVPPTVISTTTARRGDMGIYVEAIGSVSSLATVTVPSQVTGKLVKVDFTEGQLVKAGDPLAEIDARPFQAQLDAAQGQLDRDQALLTEAKLNLERYQSAYDQKAIPKQQLDDQAASVGQDAGTVKYDQGQVSNATVQLDFCHITSSVTGRVGLRLVDPGNIVQSSSTNGVVVVTQLQPITVIFSVAEDYLPQIQHQLSLSNRMVVQAFDRAQQTVLGTGSVLAMDNLIDPSAGTVRLRAIFPNDDYALFPNQFVNARLLLDTLRNQTLVPTSTIQRNGTNTFVYVLADDQTVAVRDVTVGASDGDTTAVKGVELGEVLAADNFNRLQDKAKVRLRETGDTGRGGGRGGGGEGGDRRGGRGSRGE